MFEFINKDPAQTHSQSMSITYPRTINILFGNYPIVEDLLNMTVEIKNNLSEEEYRKTNVKGGRTEWQTFNNHPFVKKFIEFCSLKHQTTHPDIFKNFYSKNIIESAWGNEINKGDHIDFHDHSCLHCILYLTNGEPLIFPELNLKIHPEPGDYYFLPASVIHGMNKSNSEKTRYTLVMNIEQIRIWDRPDFKKDEKDPTS